MLSTAERVITLVYDSHGELVKRRWLLGNMVAPPEQLTLKIGMHICVFILAPELHSPQNGGATYCQRPANWR